MCSEGELDLCIRNRIAPEQILLDGVRRTDDLLRKALDYQVAKYCVDSPGQMEQLVRMAGRGRKVFVLLRVSSGSRFGMSRQEIRQCLDLCLDREQIEIQGVQFYPGTQRNDVRRTEQELRLLEQWLVFFKENMDLPVREVQFGGGIGVPCFMSEREEDFADAFQAVAAYAERLSRDYLVTYEAGRIFAASAGFYVTEIFEKKIRDGRNIFFCAGGTNHIRYPGGMLGIRTPYLEAEYKAPLGFEQSCSLCGSLCSQEDVLARECRLDAGANPGDVVAFCNAGLTVKWFRRFCFYLWKLPDFWCIIIRLRMSFPQRLSSVDTVRDMCGPRHSERRREHILTEADFNRGSDFLKQATYEQLLGIVREIYLDSAGAEAEKEITMDTDIKKDLGFDSIMLVVLQIQIEDTFHIRFDLVQDDFQTIFTTVRNIFNCVRKYLGE